MLQFSTMNDTSSDGILWNAIVADDDMMLSTRIQAGLKTMGCSVRLVRTKDALFKSVIEGKPDLVVLNYGCARISDVETIRQLRTAGGFRILCYLSHTKIADVRKAVIEAGADRIVANSAITMRLRSIVERLMQGHEPDPADEE